VRAGSEGPELEENSASGQRAREPSRSAAGGPKPRQSPAKPNPDPARRTLAGDVRPEHDHILGARRVSDTREPELREAARREEAREEGGRPAADVGSADLALALLGESLGAQRGEDALVGGGLLRAAGGRGGSERVARGGGRGGAVARGRGRAWETRRLFSGGGEPSRRVAASRRPSKRSAASP
jgi:hypothetical protein